MTAARPEGIGRPAPLSVERIGADLLVQVGGEIDLFTVSDLHARLRQAIASATGTVLLDVSDVQFLGSNGLRMLLDLQADLTAHDRQLRVITGEVLAVTRPLQVTGLDQTLHVYPDLPAALAADVDPETGDQAV